MTLKRLSLLPLFSLLIVQALAENNTISIKTPSDLIKFSNNVNSNNGTFYGTVTLDADIDMGGLGLSFKSIGFKGNEKAFSGTFDGNGYMIFNLKLNLENRHYTGLFGNSFGMTLKNLILDKSCAISGVNTGGEPPFFLGSFVARCIPKLENCVFQNLINLGFLSARDYNFIGGIVGLLGSEYSSEFSSRIINCINFGYIAIDGKIPGISLGGIVGRTVKNEKDTYKKFFGSLLTRAPMRSYIQNCANYGHVMHLSPSELECNIGGIIGSISDNTVIQNCLDMGDVDINKYFSIGSIAGKIEKAYDLKYKIENCYWLSGTYGNKIVGKGDNEYSSSVKEYSSFTKDFKLVSPVYVNGKIKKNLVDALNSFDNASFEKWIVLDFHCSKVKKSVDPFFKIVVHKNYDSLVELIKEGYVFRGWYLDPEFRSEFDPLVDDISGVKKLCAKWAFAVNVTFIFGAEKVEKTVASDEAIKYPEVEEDQGHETEWCTQGRNSCNPIKSDENIELYLLQSPKEFTLSFKTNGGAKIKSKRVKFGSVIGKLPVPEKEGYVFVRWFIDSELSRPFYSERMPAHDVCLYAKWREDIDVDRSFARYAALFCISLIIISTQIVFKWRSIIGLRI